MPAMPMTSDEIADDLAARINAGEYKPGDRLPKYGELQRMYDVSHGTIATVVIRLKERGLVLGIRGRGVFVAAPKA